MNTHNLITGPGGWTESISEAGVMALCRAGIIKHVTTTLYDNETVRTWKRGDVVEEYKVLDLRSGAKTLNEQFPAVR